MTEAHEDLDARIRRVDPDRWLATRFIEDPHRRADVIALYALNDELARIPSAVTQPMLGEIRFAWWREAIEDVFEGRMPRAHPVTLALSAAIRRRDLPRALLEGLIDARERDLDPAPFADEAETLGYIDGTAGALAALAAKVLDPGADPHAVRSVARAWGLAGLHRLEIATGQARLPTAVTANLAGQVARAVKAARDELRTLSVAAFPAVAYVALAAPYARGRTPSDLMKRLRVTAAVATGRL